MEVTGKQANGTLFWNGKNWELRLEESSIDKYAMKTPSPIELPFIRPNSWIKISLQKKGKQLRASVIDLSDYKILGTLHHKYKKRGRRPKMRDMYCGFYTCQYGGNTITVDNFGMKRVD